MSIEVCSLQTLIRSCNMSFNKQDLLQPKQIRQALLVLWKHNLLILSLPNDIDLSECEDELNPSNTNNHIESKLLLSNSILYKINVNNIIHRLRFDKFLSYAYKKFEFLGSIILEEIYFYGHLKYKSIKVSVRERLNEFISSLKDNHEADANSSMTEDDIENQIRSYEFTDEQIEYTFQEMVKERYIVKVPFTDLQKR